MSMFLWRKFLKRYWQETVGSLALVFAVTLPVVAGSAGMAVDLAKAYNMKTRLGNALDKAALAAGSTSGSADDVEQRVLDFMAVNYPEGSLGEAYDIEVDITDGYVTVSASAKVDTIFMRILGEEFNDIIVHEEVVVKRELSGVEAVLVVDVSGSMAGSNLTALKNASTNFINIMFGRIADLEYLKIGMVPFSMSVNVGRYGWGQNPDGSAYDTGFVNFPSYDSYVSPPTNIQYGSSSPRWSGCILERSSPDDLNDDASPNWGMYRYPKSGYSGNSNTYCNSARLTPLTNNKSTLESAITALNANGGTYINVGAAWGWRILSPTFPFTEGVAYDDENWTKAIIIMTDGNNSVYNNYSAYGHNPGLSNGDLDDKLEDVCTNIKATGIRVYTITFQSGISWSTKQLFRRCATDENKYFDAPSDQELVYAFEKIANELSQLHIVK